MSCIKNIIFDLGGVLYDIRYENIADAFRKYQIDHFEKHYSKMNQSPFIDEFETGMITVPQFRDHIRSEVNKPLSDEEIDRAWNAILIDVPSERVELLGLLKSKYKLFLFSNTNAINHQFFYSYLIRKFGFDIFTLLFEKSFFSHEIHLKKPSVEAFQFIVREAGITPSESIFIDDSPQHVIGAIKTGIHGIHLKEGDTILDLFDYPSLDIKK